MNQYVYTVEATRLAMFQEHDELEQAILPQHANYIHQLIADKVAIIACAGNDPAVIKRVMRLDIFPFGVVGFDEMFSLSNCFYIDVINIFDQPKNRDIL